MEDQYEVLYRRMSEEEAGQTQDHRGLVEGRAKLNHGRINHSSDPNKWITANPNYVLNYKPRGSSAEDYSFLAVFEVAPGTLDALNILRNKREIRRGPSNAYGLTPEFTEWFNRRTISVRVYDLRIGKPELPESKVGIHYLMKGDRVLFFQAFPKEYLQEDSFSDLIKLGRMSWLKTSLLWTLWKSNWGYYNPEGRVVQMEIPLEYLLHLENCAESSKNSTPENEVIYQNDPDRRIIGRFWSNGHDYWVKAGTTKHFGVRGESWTDYVFNIIPGNLIDITEVVQEVEKKRPEHPKKTLYEILGYTEISRSSLSQQ